MTAPVPPLGVDRLVAWLLENRHAYTDEALHDRLISAGHPRADVDAALERIHEAEAAEAAAGSQHPTAGPPPPAAGVPPPVGGGATRSMPGWPPPEVGHAPVPPPPGAASRSRDALLAFLAAVGVIVGLPVLLANLGAPGLALPLGFVALLVAIVGWGMARDAGRRGVATGLGVAVVLIIVVPVVAVVALFGMCVVGGGFGGFGVRDLAPGRA
jgi:hypothetical protein